MPKHTVDHAALPYRIAVLCYVYDDRGRVLMLHRTRSPNAEMYSPIGGKLEVGQGEAPHDCALREMHEEAGLDLQSDDVRLIGIVSEKAYDGEMHWLIFLFEVTRPIPPGAVTQMQIDEGTLEWIHRDDVPSLAIPDTDRTILWPLVQEHEGGFFMVHIDCSRKPVQWTVQESESAGTKGRRD